MNEEWGKNNSSNKKKLYPKVYAQWTGPAFNLALSIVNLMKFKKCKH